MEHLKVETSGMEWEAVDGTGVERKVLASDILGGLNVELQRLAPGASLAVSTGDTIEVTVTAGAWSSPAGTLTAGGYVRLGAEALKGNLSANGCVLFVRTHAADPEDSEPVFEPLDPDAWRAGHGNLRVRPLHAAGTVGTALVHWPAGEQFLPHRHFGGEEIFVLSGTFEDEHGRYPAGTWMLSPHMSEHQPFVREETLIYVKTGHAPPTQ